MNNFETKIMRVIGESGGAILVIALISGALTGLLKFFLVNILKFFGVDYFAEISEAHRWIGQILIESRAVLNADRVCFYRTSNGKVYIEDSENSNNGIKIYSVINITKNKSISQLPENLERRHLDWFLDIQKTDDFLERFTPDMPMESPLRNILIKHGIIAYMAVKVKFYSDLYGIIVYTWSDVSLIPKNLDMKHREYLEDIKNAVLVETIFIISRSLRFYIHSFSQKFKYFFSRKANV